MIVKDPALMKRMHAEAGLCEWCHGEEMLNGSLQCHHIRPKGMGGGSRLDVAFNLVMLCLACHEKAQRNKIPESVLWGIAAEREVRRLLRMPKEGAT